MDQILAGNIRKYRKMKGFTQPQLAEIANLSFRSIQDIEYSKTWPGVDTVQRIAQALGVAPGKLFEDAQGMQTPEPPSKEKLLISLIEIALKLDYMSLQGLVALAKSRIVEKSEKLKGEEK